MNEAKVATLLDRVDRTVAWIIETAALVSGVCVVVLILFAVLGRYVFDWSTPATLEIMLVIVMWFYMFGIVIGSRNNEHITVDILESAIQSPGWKRAHEIFVSGFKLLMSVLLLILAASLLAWSLKRPQATPTLQLPVWLSQSALLFAGIGCSAYGLRDLLFALAGRPVPEPATRTRGS